MDARQWGQPEVYLTVAFECHCPGVKLKRSSCAPARARVRLGVRELATGTGSLTGSHH
jgi:hypothetical protein